MGLHENVAAMRLWAVCPSKHGLAPVPIKVTPLCGWARSPIDVCGDHLISWGYRGGFVSLILGSDVADYQAFRLAASGRYV